MGSRLQRRLREWLIADEYVVLANQPPSGPLPPDPDQAWKALDLVNGWIRHSDNKAVAVLAAAAGAGVAFYNLTKDNLVKDTHHPDYPITLTAIACVLFVLIAGLFAASAIIPRQKVKGQSEDNINLLFYSHIARKYKNDSPSYEDVLKTLTANKPELTRHIANQVHANSVVAERKFNLTGYSIMALAASLFCLGALAAITGLCG